VTAIELIVAFVALALSYVLGVWVERRLQARDPDSWLSALFAGRLRWAAFVLAVPIGLHITGIFHVSDALRLVSGVLDAKLLMLGDKPVTISTVFIVMAVVAVSFQISGLVQRRIHKQMAAHGVSEEGSVAVGARLAHYVVVVLGIMVGLQTAGIDLSALFAAGAVFAVGLGFAMQTLTQNFVAGVILIVERAIKPGDILGLHGSMVRVERMGIRSTVVRDLDDVEIIVPNSELVTGIKNYTMSDRMMRLRVGVGVAYDSDMAHVFATLQAAAEAFEPRDPTRATVVHMTGFGASSVDFEVSVWTTQPWKAATLKSHLHRHLWDALAAADVVIAFPQLDVHLDEGVVKAIGKQPAA
jgi:small-conductance mechanosensitive channel